MPVYRTWPRRNQVTMANTDQYGWKELTYNPDGWVCYNDSIQIFSIDLRDILAPYSGWFIDGILIETWSRRKGGSGWHTRWLTDINMDPGSDDPRSQPFPMIGSHLTPGYGVAVSKDGVRSQFSELIPYAPIPVDRYINRLMPFGFKGELDSRRSYGWLGVYGLSLFKDNVGFPGWAGDIMQQNLGRTGYLSDLIGTGRWATDYTGGRVYW